jgi:hypothetical protein
VNDSLEQEAERIAERVMNTPEADGEPGRTQTGRVQVGEAGAFVNPAIMDEVMRSPGQPLDSGTLGFMEPRFGCDFSRVRVHHDGAAGLSARGVNARAYTVGHDIVFGAGRGCVETHRIATKADSLPNSSSVLVLRIRISRPRNVLVHA